MQTLDNDPRFVVFTYLNADAHTKDGTLLPFTCVQDIVTGRCAPSVVNSYWKLCIWTDVDDASNYALECAATQESNKPMFTVRPVFGESMVVDALLVFAEEAGSATREREDDFNDFPNLIVLSGRTVSNP